MDDPFAREPDEHIVIETVMMGSILVTVWYTIQDPDRWGTADFWDTCSVRTVYNGWGGDRREHIRKITNS